MEYYFLLTDEHNDKINEKVVKQDYLDMTKRFINYSKNNKRVPSTILTKTSKTKVNFELFTFKETITIDSENVETRRVKLRVSPVDPIRQVILNKDTDEETELYEDVDFTVDYTSKELIFSISSIEGEYCRLKENDSLEIIYTPNLEDTSIAIGYYAHRLNSNYQCRIKPNYFEYKV